MMRQAANALEPDLKKRRQFALYRKWNSEPAFQSAYRRIDMHGIHIRTAGSMTWTTHAFAKRTLNILLVKIERQKPENTIR